MQPVRVGQVWSCLNLRRCRVDFLVERIENAPEPRAFGRYVGTTRDKIVSFAVSALSRGSRGARLVRESDGSTPFKKPPKRVIYTEEDRKTASDYRRTCKPKGMATASAQMEEAYTMRFELGMTLDQVAAHFAIPRNRVSQWCSSVRQKREEQRYLEGGDDA